MNFIRKMGKGVLLCFAIAVPSWFLGELVPAVGAPVFGILFGMILALLIKDRGTVQDGIGFVSKKVLQTAVVFLGFGLNLSVIWETGKQSLPIIVTTIAAALAAAYVFGKVMKIPGRITALVGVGSAIYEEVAQSISVIFFFNLLAALIFPSFGALLGFSTESGEAFGIFAGTAVNDTSSVTAAASVWDSLYGLGSETLDKAVIVKLTRTLAIIPITLILALAAARKAKADGENVRLKSVFPMFILYFIAASVVTTVAVAAGVTPDFFAPLKTVSKFLIVAAMCAIGLNTNIVKLIKTGGKPLALGFCCWMIVTAVSLAMQRLLGIW